MLNLLCFVLGVMTIFYEVNNINTNILFQYSGWFVILTSLLHFLQFFYKIPSFLAYVCISIGIFIVFPACVPTLTTFDKTFQSYLLYGVGGHIFLPLFTIFHLDKTTYSNISNSVLLILLYNTLWVFNVEYFSIEKPYNFLDTLILEYRILSYILVSIVGIIGLLVISILPWISKNNTIHI